MMGRKISDRTTESMIHNDPTAVPRKAKKPNAIDVGTEDSGETRLDSTDESRRKNIPLHRTAIVNYSVGRGFVPIHPPLVANS